MVTGENRDFLKTVYVPSVNGFESVKEKINCIDERIGNKIDENYDPKGKMFVTAGKILDAYKNNEFQSFIVYGGLGYGKSSYSLKTMFQVYGTWDWEEHKKHLCYTPQEFINIIKAAKEREKLLVWDDAGVWIFNLDTYDPFIKTLTKWFSVARTKFAGVIFTSPSPMWIVRKIRYLPQCMIVKIVKSSGSSPRLRTAKAYLNWTAPDFKKTGVKLKWEDHFNVRLPDDYYAKYNPYRESYAQIIQDSIEKELNAQTKRALKKAGMEKDFSDSQNIS
jgi:hypothetical protein